MRNRNPSRESSESLVEMSRLNNLSDGVFAIALTLLAFDLRLPAEAPIGNLPTLAPKFIVYLISFVIIGGAWSSHQRMLNQIKRGDGPLVWFNLACLLFVGLLPASAAILGRYPEEFLSIACFALNVALIQLTTLWLWRHASRQGLINPALDPRVVTSIGRRLNFSAVIFVLSTPLALWSIWITYVFWVGLFILLFTTDWLDWQLATRKHQTTFPLDQAKRARIHVQHKEGYLRIDSQVAENILLDGVFGAGLESHVDRSGDTADIQLRAAERSGLLSWKYPWSWVSAGVLDWTLHLSDQIPIELEIKTYSGRLALELGSLQITDLKIDADTSETQISLPDREGQTTVNIEVTTAFITIRVPPKVAATIHIEIEAAKVEVDLERFAMIEEGREYRSKRYRVASKRADIRIAGTMSSVEIL